MPRCILSAWIISLVLVSGTQAQNQPQLDGILSNLVDSKLNANSQAQLQPVPQSSISPQMQQARQVVKSYADATRQLVTALYQEQRYAPSVGPLVGEALNHSATADVLVQRSQSMSTVAQLRPEYEKLNQQWHVLAHRIKNSPNLETNIYRRVDTVNGLSTRLEELLAVRPQLQRDDLLYHFTMLYTDFGHLIEDVRIDMVQDPQRDQYLAHLQRLQTFVYGLRDAAERDGTRDEIVARYKLMHKAWLPVKAKLRAVDDRYIQRNIGRIVEVNDHLHELLWIAPVIDGNDVLYLANSLRTNVDEIAEQLSLKRLVALPNAMEVFEKCLDFYTQCGDFQQAVTTQTELEALVWDYRTLEVSWTDLQQVLGNSENPDTIQKMAIVENSMKELRKSLGLRATVDVTQAAQIASSLDQMSDQLYFDVNRYVGISNRYPSQFRSQTLNLTQSFHNSARSLHENVRNWANADQLREQTVQLVNQFNSVQQQLSQVLQPERNEIYRTVQNIAPLLAQLQVMYNYR